MLPEDRLLGHYRLVRRVGSGGMGEVYLAEDTRINRQVAIKIVRAEAELYPDQVTLEDTRRLFQREMQAITMLDHPYILPLYDFGEENDGDSTLTYMVMPLRQEGDLTGWLQRHRSSEKLTPDEVSHFVMQAADALQHAHERHLVHQDVKPSNFLVRERSGSLLPDLLLMDFGIARINTTTATASQNIRGTPAFMAPEQWEGQPQSATDQYALAIMAYLLLTGRPPFSGRMEQVMRQHFMLQPSPPSSLNPAVSPALDAVILRALAKEPARRFSSILEFARAFQEALQSSSDQDATVIASKKAAASTVPADAAVPEKSPPDVIAPPPPPPTPIVYPAAFTQQAPLAPAYHLPTYPSTDTAIDSQFWTPPTPPPPPPGTLSNKSVGSSRKSRWLLPVLIVVAVLVITSSVIGIGIYRISVNPVHVITTAIADSATSGANETATQQPQETAPAQTVAYPSYLSGSGTLAFFDPLSQPGKWTSSSTSSTSGACQFTAGAYHVSQQTNDYFNWCRASGIFSNFAFEVQLTITQGDCGGMVFRDDGNQYFYYFSICQDSTYFVNKYAGSDVTTLRTRSSSAINAGWNRQNKIAVVANGSIMTFYVNEQQIDQEQDSSYASGSIELIAAPYYHTGNATDVAYSNARLWTL